MSLLGGDWNVNKEYDPHLPNDYEKERKEQASRTKLATSILPPTASSLLPRSLVGAYSDDEDDGDFPTNKAPTPVSRGAAIAPPPSLVEPNTRSSESSFEQPSSLIQPPTSIGKGSVAAKIMARMGYKEGQGLGKGEQGIARALEVEKTSKRGGKIVQGDVTQPIAAMPLAPLASSLYSGLDAPLPQPSIVPTPVSQSTPPLASTAAAAAAAAQKAQSIVDLMRNPTKVILLRNMVGPGEVDDDLEPEVKEECSKYGEVARCLIYEIPKAHPEEAVRIFVEFKRVEAAIKAVVDLNGRYFGGRVVKINFYDVDKFKKLQLND